MVNIIKQEIDIEEATKQLNAEMDEAAEEFYKTKKVMAYHYNILVHGINI